MDLISGGLSIFDNVNYLTIFKNNKGLLSEDTVQSDLIPLFPCAVAWIDINGDNYTDLLTLGRLDLNGVSHMYINDGMGKLIKSSDQPFEIPSILHAISVGDHNSDGYDDIAIAHLNGTEMHTNIYTNEYGSSSINEFSFIRPRINW